MPRKQFSFPILPAALVAMLALAVAVVVIARQSNSSGTSATTSTASGESVDGAPLPATPAPPFTLTDESGRKVSLSEYRGRVTVITFLYPGCGATCTVIAQQIRGALDELSSPPAVLIITADPAADSPAAVARFLASVSLTGRASFLTGTESELRPIWSAYRVKPAADGPTTFSSYAFVMLLDPSGRERVLFETEQLTPEALSHDIRALQRG
jgi:protein SCO1/2